MYLPTLKDMSVNVLGRSVPKSSGPVLSTYFPDISLDLAGVIALADLTAVLKRTVLKGNSRWLDALVLCPGMHREQWASELSNGEIPTVALLNGDAKFRIENPGAVIYLRREASSFHLTTFEVSKDPFTAYHWREAESAPAQRASGSTHQNIHSGAHVEEPTSTSPPPPTTFWDTWTRVETWKAVWRSEAKRTCARVTYLLSIALTLTVAGLLGAYNDWWGLAVVGVLVLCRLLNIVVIKRRTGSGELGGRRASYGYERRDDGAECDMLVLMSEDRWVRIRGGVNDVKAFTAGQWLREITPCEGLPVACATVLMYLDAALASNMTLMGKVLLMVLLIGTAGLMEITNMLTDQQIMRGCVVKKVDEVPHSHRWQMTRDLLQARKRDMDGAREEARRRGIKMAEGVPQDKFEDKYKTKWTQHLGLGAQEWVDAVLGGYQESAEDYAKLPASEKQRFHEQYARNNQASKDVHIQVVEETKPIV